MARSSALAWVSGSSVIARFRSRSARPVTDDPESFEGVEAVLAPNVGIYDCLTSEGFGSNEAWVRSVLVTWKNWVKERAPVADAPGPTRVGHVVLGPNQTAGFATG
jgi:hypothetical protein